MDGGTSLDRHRRGDGPLRGTPRVIGHHHRDLHDHEQIPVSDRQPVPWLRRAALIAARSGLHVLAVRPRQANEPVAHVLRGLALEVLSA